MALKPLALALTPLALPLMALLLPAACGKGDTGQTGTGAPPPTEQLHPPGDLRLTSAGKTPRLPLRYRHAEGQSQAFRTSLSVEHLAAGQRSRVGAELDWERTVVSTSGAMAQVRMQVLRVRTVRPVRLRDTLAPQLGRLSILASVDRRGRVTAVQFPGAREPPGGKDLFARITAPLPEDAVGDGATWERTEPFTLTLPRVEQPVSIGLSTRYRLSLPRGGGGQGSAVIAAELKLHVVHSPKQGSRALRVTGGGKGTSKWVLDLERGEPTNSSSRITLDLTVTTNGRQQPLTQTMEVRTRPLPPPRSRPESRTP